MFALNRRISFAILALFAHAAAANTVFCVTNDANGPSIFDTALTYWTNAVNETVYVHVEQGTYSILKHTSGYVSIGLGTGYDQDGGNYGGAGNATLHLVGGFVHNTNCKSRVVDPKNTVIHGDPSAGVRVFRLAQQQGAILIDGVRFDVESGVVIHPSATAVTVRNVIVSGVNDGVTDNETGAALSFFADDNSASGNSFLAENVLVYGNSVPGLYVISGNSNDSVEIVNSTIADNGGYGIGVGDLAYAPRNFAGTFGGYNLIARGNASDIAVAASSTTPSIIKSDFHSKAGTISGSGNVDLDPQFVDSLNGNYDLKTTSPVINTGALASSVPGGYPGTDIRGRTRVIGSRVDLGAYESNVDDTAAQMVTSTADDSTAGTLRTAITAANGSSNPTTITFNIAGGCTTPQVVELLSAMPDITSDVTIDGYTQPGSAPNTTAPGYNGKICIIFDGFTQSYGLHTTGSGRLTVRGIDFERFSAAAVHLSSSAGNVVTGNTFAQDPNYAASAVGVLIDGTASASQVGNYAFGDRNVFNRMTDSGVKIVSNGAGQHSVVGNYFGFNPDGSIYSILSSQRNEYGVYISASGSNLVSVNYIGGSIDSAIYLAGAATTANTVSSNALGPAPDGSTFGNGQGGCNGPLCLVDLPSIDIVSGAHDNVIGESGCVAGIIGANTIAGNHGPGVGLESSAGTGNSVCGNNLIYGNNGYLAVDLGDDGPTTDDVGDADTGPNKLQNYPILYEAQRIAPTVARISGVLETLAPGPAQGYHLDVYWTDTCITGDAQGPRGELKQYVGFINLFTNGSVYADAFPSADMTAAAGLPVNGFLTAVATDASGNTSEPGTCVAFANDYIFADGFGH